VEDITERKAAQEKLEHERNLLKTLIDAIPDEIAVKDPDRGFVLVNPATVRALKQTSDIEVIGRRDEDLIPEEHAVEGRLEEERILAGGIGFVNKEGKTRVNPQSGEIERSILISKIPLRDKKGNVTGLVVINRDITQRKRAEVEVQRSREWLRAVLDASRDGIVAEKQEIISYANASYARIYGYDNASELIGRHVSTVQAPEDNRRVEEFGRRRLLGDQMPDVYEFKGVRKDGKQVDLEASVSTAEIAGEEYIISTVRDISERKLLQRQFIEAQKMESIGTLAGGIAHDFNNILAIIMGHTSLLESIIAMDPQKREESLQAITKATQRGAGLVRQLLTFARKADVAMQSVLVNEVITELVKLMKETFPKTIAVELNLAESLPSVIADANQLHQVFLNLCVNARDAMQPKGGTLSISSRLVAGEEVQATFDRAGASEYIAIDVADTGSGMDEGTLRRIFEPFFTTKEKGKGTGLGLATVYGIIEGHRGFVNVESTLGKGTIFHIYLPVPPRIIKREEVEGVQEPEPSGGSETILLVEDEAMLSNLVCLLLEQKGYHVFKASDAEEGLDVYRKHAKEIDIVITDMGLPKFSGEELFARIRKLNPNAKVILASGYVAPEAKSELLKAGAKEFIQKPYIPSELLRRIRAVLDA
jgi:PAS domain S-box-containing protein